MTIEIKLTCDTVTEAQAEMVALLRGTNITFGSELTAIAPVAPTPTHSAAQTGHTSSVAEAGPTTVAPSTTTRPSESGSSASEQPKRGRGRPKKDAGQVTAIAETTTNISEADGISTEPTAGPLDAPAETKLSGSTETADEEQIGLPLGSEAAPTTGATEADDGEAADASATSSADDAGNAPVAPVAGASGSAAGASPPAADIQSVSDVDLQRFCAKLAEKFGGPQKVFDACKPYLAKGDVPRPTNIKRNEDRWAFIRQMEAESGFVFHG